MGGPAPNSRKIRFGEFELDPRTGELRTAGRKFSLQEQPFQILSVLLERPGELVTRDELKKRLWASDTFVDFDHSLNKAVNRLREALDDSAEHPRFIETLPRRGYRFIAPVAGANGNDAVDVSISPSYTAGPSPHAAPVVPPIQEQPQSSGPAFLSNARRRLLPIVAAVLALAVSSFGIYRWATRNRVPTLEALRITPLTDSGRATAVAISADGRYVAYTQAEPAGDAVRVRQIGTDSDIQIVPPERVTFFGLTFSADASYLYFVHSSPELLNFANLYSTPLLGGAVRLVLKDLNGPVSFSPDGRQLAFTRGIVAQNSIEVRIADSDGSHERLIATIPHSFALRAQGAGWSPDGSTIATSFGREGLAGWALDSISLADGNIRELYSSPRAIGTPRWLADGKGLIVALDDSDQRGQLWIIPYPGGQPRRITNDLANYDPYIDVARNARTVAALAQSPAYNLWEAPSANPSDARQLTFGALPIVQIAEGLDGKLLARGWTGDVWTMRPDGSERVLLPDVHNAGSVVSCGSYVLLTSFQTAAGELVRLDADGTNRRTLATAHPFAPVCSPDAKSVFFLEMAHPAKIWRISIEGGAPTEIAVAGGDSIGGSMAISPDGKFLAYPFEVHSGLAGTRIVVVPTDGGAPVRSFDVTAGIGSVRWLPDGKALVYLATRNGVRNLWQQPVVGGAPKQLTQFASNSIVSFNWSRDGRRVFLVRGSVTSDVVILQNFR